ncbi:MAG: glycerol-3-phosphate acyltransferase [Acidimicrobiia bacterium]
MDDVLSMIAAAVAGYLIGTFPTAALVTRLATRGRVDIRDVGSGNPGGFNTMHAVGTGWGVLVILVDIAKGAVAALVGWAIGGTPGAYAGATAGIVGHIVPVWSGFRGGKGVATSAGAVLAVFPIFFPVDAAAAAVGALGFRNAERAIWLTCPLWIVSGIVWWLADLPNLWGPEPTVGLAIFAVVSAVIILAKFAASRPRTAAPNPSA